MKKVCLTLLCLTLLLSNAAWTGSVQAEPARGEAAVSAQEIQPLAQLGALDTTDPEATVTKATLAGGLNTVVGNGAGDRYFAGQDLHSPLLYGQAVMVLMDMMGYTPYVEMLGYDTAKAEGYLQTARRIRLISDASASANQKMTVNQYAPLLYQALMEVPVMETAAIMNDEVRYRPNGEDTMLNVYMKLVRIDGVVTGLDHIVIDSRDAGKENGIKIGGKWYDYSLTENLYGYFGRRVEAYVTDTIQPELKCLYMRRDSNKELQIQSEDIASADVRQNSIRYYDGKRQNRAVLSPTVDVIYNRELLRDFTGADLTQPDAVLTLIDNDGSGGYDVALVERYKSYVVFSSTPSTGRILDLYGNTHDLNEYFQEGYKLYNARGESVGLNIPVRYDVISYLEAASGQITYMRVTSQQASGLLQSQRENMKYLTIEDAEYVCTADYLNMPGKSTEISVGDMVTAFLDCNGRIVDIRQVSDSAEAAYLLAVKPGTFGEVRLRMLDSDGQIKVVETTARIRLDGESKTASEALQGPAFTDGSGFKDQLILYRKNDQGRITYIDTAEEVSKIGSRGNEGFTLDFDYEKNGTVYNLRMNDKGVIGSKYIPSSATTLFGVVLGREEYSYVQIGTTVPVGSALPENTALNLKMYNVNENYEPEYIVRVQDYTYGGWVDYWGAPYIIDSVGRSISETGEEQYQVEVYTSTGQKRILYTPLEYGDIKTVNYNVVSGDNRLLDIELKDLPRGTVAFIATDFYGISAIAVQHVPMQDGSEIIFERTTGSSSGTSYGISERTFNGQYLMSYGQVIDRIDLGIVVNNHIPTEDELAEGASFPMESWNRALPLVDTDTVFLYEKSEDRLTVETADCIIPGDHVYIKRSAAAYNGIYVYRD